MKKILIVLLALSSISGFASLVEYDEIICGELAYTDGSYVLMADHEENYTVREEKIAESSLKMTTLMRKIVENHNYDLSDYPQACFYGVTSQRVDSSELDVLVVLDVQLRKSIE